MKLAFVAVSDLISWNKALHLPLSKLAFSKLGLLRDANDMDPPNTNIIIPLVGMEFRFRAKCEKIRLISNADVPPFKPVKC